MDAEMAEDYLDTIDVMLTWLWDRVGTLAARADAGGELVVPDIREDRLVWWPLRAKADVFIVHPDCVAGRVVSAPSLRACVDAMLETLDES
jgi:hypothetical protein